MSRVSEAVAWALLLAVQFAIFLGFAWILTGVLSSLCELVGC